MFRVIQMGTERDPFYVRKVVIELLVTEEGDRRKTTILNSSFPVFYTKVKGLRIGHGRRGLDDVYLI